MLRYSVDGACTATAAVMAGLVPRRTTTTVTGSGVRAQEAVDESRDLIPLTDAIMGDGPGSVQEIGNLGPSPRRRCLARIMRRLRRWTRWWGSMTSCG